MPRSKTVVAIGLATTAIGAGGGLAYRSYLQPPKTKSVAAAPAPVTPAPAISTKALPVQPSGSLQILTANSDIPPVDPNGIFKHGSPGPVIDELQSLALCGAYDRRTRNPWWVAEHITTESVAQSVGKRNNSAFSEDGAIPPMFRARLKDYHKSGYDRGHQVPAANANWSQQAMDDTFKLSNMCPQVGEGFNRHYWAGFERFCRNLTQRYPSVRIVTGPLYLPKRGDDGKWHVSYEVVGDPPNVAVPTHFFKVILGEDDDTDELGNRVAVGAFVLPNAPIDKDALLANFETNIELVERASGLQFARDLKSDRRKRLCEEVKCDTKVRDFGKELSKSKL